MILVVPLRCVEYKPSTVPNKVLFEVSKNWDSKSIRPVAIQTIFKHINHIAPPNQTLKVDIGPKTEGVLIGNSKHYGELVMVMDTINLEKTGRLHSEFDLTIE